MVVLAGAEDLIALFIGFELLSIPLYVLCATELRRATSLESGLKYLIVGSVGSATLVYGLAFVYGATGATGYDEIAARPAPRTSTATCCCSRASRSRVTGLAFKASVAPFHQWTPDVYEGAPTPVTAFMAVATKAAAFGVLLRFFDVALIPAAATRGRRSWPCWRRSRSSSATSARSASRRSSACSPTRRSPRRATCSPASSCPPQLGVAATDVLPGRLPADEPGGVRRHRRARARLRARRRPLGDERPRRPSRRCWRGR